MFHNINLKTVARIALAIASFGCLTMAHAAFNGVSNNGANTLIFPTTPMASPSAPLTVTITGNSTAGIGSQLNAIQINGTNPGDFALVAGGTCAVNTVLANGDTCTQNIRFTPTTTGARSGLFQISCSPIILIGGFTVSCGNGIGTLANLSGIGSAMTAAVQSVPTLDPTALTLLALMMMITAGYFGFRRRAN